MKKTSLVILAVGIVILLLPMILGGYSSLLLVPIGGVVLGLGVILFLSSLIVPKPQPETPFSKLTPKKSYPIVGVVFTASILLFLSYFASIPYFNNNEWSLGLLLLWATPFGVAIALYITAIVLRIKSSR